jgi:hypothetical protein
MKSFSYTLSIVVISFSIILCDGCSKEKTVDTKQSIIGIWQNQTGSVTFEFLDTATVKASFPSKLPHKESLPPKLSGVIIDAGFWLISYYSKTSFEAMLEKGATSSKTQIVFQNVETSKQVPWAKVIFLTDRKGNSKIFDKIKGESISGFKVLNSGSVEASTKIKDSVEIFPQFLFSTDYFDMNYNWCGKISINASYRFLSDTTLQIYLPSRVDTTVKLVILNASLRDTSLAIVGTGTLLNDCILNKISTPENRKSSPVTKNVFDPTEIAGVMIEENIYVNTGVTTDRYQNVRFRLPGKEALGNIKATELTGQQVEPLIIKRGAN